MSNDEKMYIYKVEFDEGYRYIKAHTYIEAVSIFKNLFSNEIKDIKFIADFDQWYLTNEPYLDVSDMTRKKSIEDNQKRCEVLPDWLKDVHHCIPERLEYLAESYPNVKWSQAIKLYKNAVQVVCNIYDINFIFDLGNRYGEGFREAEKFFKQFLEEAENASVD